MIPDPFPPCKRHREVRCPAGSVGTETPLPPHPTPTPTPHPHPQPPQTWWGSEEAPESDGEGRHQQRWLWQRQKGPKDHPSSNLTLWPGLNFQRWSTWLLPKVYLTCRENSTPGGKRMDGRCLQELPVRRQTKLCSNQEGNGRVCLWHPVPDTASGWMSLPWLQPVLTQFRSREMNEAPEPIFRGLPCGFPGLQPHPEVPLRRVEV